MTVPLHAHKVTARNDGRHIVPLTIVEQKFKFRIELHPCAFESGGDELCTVPNALNKFIRFKIMKIWNFGVNALQLHLFCPHNTKLEIAAVFTAAISHWIAPSALPVGRPVKRALISNIE